MANRPHPQQAAALIGGHGHDGGGNHAPPLVPNPDGSLPSVHEARDYVARVKSTLGPASPAYRTFLSALRGYRAGDLSPVQVIERMQRIFGRNGELIVGFNAFLPVEFRIAAPPRPAVIVEEEEDRKPPAMEEGSPVRTRKRKKYSSSEEDEDGDDDEEEEASPRLPPVSHPQRQRPTEAAPQDPAPRRKRIRVRASSSASRGNIKVTSAPPPRAPFTPKRRIDASTQILLASPQPHPSDMVHAYDPGHDGEYAYDLHTDHVDCQLCKGQRDEAAMDTTEPVLLCEQRGCNAEYHLGCLYDHDPPLFPARKLKTEEEKTEDGEAAAKASPDSGDGGQSPLEVPLGDIYCVQCAEQGSTSVLEKYFDKVEYERSHYACSRAYVSSLLEKHMKANPDGNVIERSLAQSKAGMGEIRWRPSPRSELWYAAELRQQALLQDEGRAGAKVDSVNDTAEWVVGKPVRLYNNLDNEYHVGRVVDWRACTVYPSLYKNGDGPPVTKSNTVQMKDLEYYGTSPLATSEFLVRFPAGPQGRKKELLRWIVLEEHSLAVGVALVRGKTSKLRGGSTSHGMWKPAMILARSALELVTVRSFLREDDDGNLFARMRLDAGHERKDPTRPADRWALASFFGEEQHALLRLRDEARDLRVDGVGEDAGAGGSNASVPSIGSGSGETNHETNEEGTKAPDDNPQAFGEEEEKPAADLDPPPHEREPLADVDVPLGLALAERAEQVRCAEWCKLILEKSNHARALVSSDEHAAQLRLEERDAVPVDAEDVNPAPGETARDGESATGARPLVERGVDRMWLAGLVENATGKSMPRSKDLLLDMKIESVASASRAMASLQRRRG